MPPFVDHTFGPSRLSHHSCLPHPPIPIPIPIPSHQMRRHQHQHHPTSPNSIKPHLGRPFTPVVVDHEALAKTKRSHGLQQSPVQIAHTPLTRTEGERA